MTLTELRDSVNHALDHWRNSDDPEVVITLSNPSVGPRASCGVLNATLGFDWEYGQFRIQPQENLRMEGRTLEDPTETYVVQYLYDYRNKRHVIHYCRNCGNVVNKDVNFCQHCGQRIKISDKIHATKDYRTNKL